MELREGQSVVLTGKPKTASGHPAAYQTGSAQWTSSDESVATVEQDPNDELKGRVRGIDGSNNESVVIECRVDGDPDADQERILIGTKSVTVTQGEATVFDLEDGPIEDEGTPEQPAPIETPAETPAETETETTSEGSETGATDEGTDNAGSGVADGEVKAGDPGTATGPPIESDAPKGEDEPGEIGGVPVTDVPGADDNPIAGEESPNPANPVEGTEADSTVPGGSHTPADDNASPSNLPGTGGNAF